MVKKMIYLDPDREKLLKAMAAEQGVSETEVMRRALDRFAATSREDPLKQLIGMLDGYPVNGDPSDGSVNHDKYIHEAIEAKIARGHKATRGPR
jgi:hypothetical protein